MDSSQGSRTLQFQFHGKAGEYFKIWIVNIALSILTLGIYSAWAKVRTRRYFYGNTALDGSRFDYLADPLAILKGRMIVFAVILVYAVSVQYIPPVEFLFILLYLVALPWMIVKSMQFNTRNTSYRNVRFNFDGSLKEAVLIFVGLSILIPFTLGLILPYVIKRYKQYMVANSMFGTTHFNFDAATKSFYWIYIKAFIVPIILIAILAALAMPAYNDYIEKAKMMQQSPPEEIQPDSQQLPESQAEIWNQPEQMNDNYNLPDQWQQADDIQAMPENWPQDWPQQDDMSQPPHEFNPLEIIPTFIILALYLLLGVYIQTRTSNLVICGSHIREHRLQSTLRVRDMFSLYLTNIIAILISLGLLIPWAKIRVARYRFAHTALIASGSIDNFIAGEVENVKATGGEFTDAFDVDLGF